METDTINLLSKDYYAVLGLNRNASQEEVKVRFRELSKQFHPDKQPAHLREFANEYFHQIERAYTILGDEKKRSLYDTYGEKAVKIYENNEQLVEKDSSIDDVQDLIHTIYQRELEGRAGQSSIMNISIDASSFLDPPKARPMPSFYQTLPDPASKSLISSIVLQQAVQMKLTPKDTLSVTGSVNCAGGRGMGVAVLSYQKQLGKAYLLGLSGVLGSYREVSASVTQVITNTLQGVIGLTYGREGVKSQIQLVDQISDHVVGIVGATLGKTTEGSIKGQYTDEKNKVEGEMSVDEMLGGKLSYTRVFGKESRSRVKMSAQLNAHAAGVEWMVGEDVDAFSKVNANVSIGLEGVFFKIKYQRGNMQFVVPVLLSQDFTNGIAIALSFSLSGLLYGVRRLWKRLTQKKEPSSGTDDKRTFLYEHNKLCALSEQQMMGELVKKRKAEEEKKNGLRILKATYARKSDPGNAMDVTVPLQFLVKNATLKLFAGSKRDYIGFCYPSAMEVEDVMLSVRYAFQHNVYELEIGDLEPLYLPAFRATCIGEEGIVV